MAEASEFIGQRIHRRNKIRSEEIPCRVVQSSVLEDVFLAVVFVEHVTNISIIVQTRRQKYRMANEIKSRLLLCAVDDTDFVKHLGVCTGAPVP